MSRTLASALILLAIPLASHAQGSFEGAVDYRMTAEDGTTTMTSSLVKGGRTRTEVKGEGATGVMIMDNDAGKWITLMPEQKMYMVMDFKGMASGAAAAEKGKAANDKTRKAAEGDPDVAVQRTGRKETVAGIECEHYLMQNAKEKSTVDMCLARGMGVFMGMSLGAAGGGLGDLAAAAKSSSLSAAERQMVSMMKDGAFLLKMEATEGKKRTMTMEATRVERKKLDDALFKPPADYKPFDAAAFGKPPAR
jgi:outer membrane lipoprotein-sorting protein